MKSITFIWIRDNFSTIFPYLCPYIQWCDVKRRWYIQASKKQRQAKNMANKMDCVCVCNDIGTPKKNNTIIKQKQKNTTLVHLCIIRVTYIYRYCMMPNASNIYYFKKHRCVVVIIDFALLFFLLACLTDCVFFFPIAAACYYFAFF